MEGIPAEEVEEEEEYVMLNFDSVSSEIHIPPNEPYVLSVTSLFAPFESLIRFLFQLCDDFRNHFN